MQNHEPQAIVPGRTGQPAGTLPAIGAHPGADDGEARAPFEQLRYLDVAVVLLAVPLGLVLGAPAFGLLLGAGAWLTQRALERADRLWISRARVSGSRLGLDIAEAFGRIWLLAGAIVIAGAVGQRADGLAAALTIFAAYSIAFAVRLMGGRGGFER